MPCSKYVPWFWWCPATRMRLSMRPLPARDLRRVTIGTTAQLCQGAGRSLALTGIPDIPEPAIWGVGCNGLGRGGTGRQPQTPRRDGHATRLYPDAEDSHESVGCSLDHMHRAGRSCCPQVGEGTVRRERDIRWPVDPADCGHHGVAHGLDHRHRVGVGVRHIGQSTIRR